MFNKKKLLALTCGTIKLDHRINDLGLLASRLALGLMMALAHGINKMPPSERFLNGVASLGFPAPFLFAWIAGLTEFIGAILISLGLATRLNSFLLAITMLVAGLGRHWADPFKQKELALVYLFAFITFIVTGPGKYSLDHYFFWRLKKS